MMGLSRAERKAVPKTIATRYTRADKVARESSSTNCVARPAGTVTTLAKVLHTVLIPRVVTARAPRPATYGPKVIAALVF